MIAIEYNPDEANEKGYDPDAQLARDVLKHVLGDAYTRADEDRHADVYEAATKRALKRHHETWAEYAKRKKALAAEASKQTFFTDVESARSGLELLLERARSGVPLSAGEIRTAHEYESILGRPATDFSKPIPAPEDAAAASLLRFKRIAERELWEDRIALVKKEKDYGALQHVILRDAREEVRFAARERLMELELAAM